MISFLASIVLILVQLVSIQVTNTTGEEVTCNQDLLDRSFVTQCGSNICEPLFEFEGEKKPSEWPSSKDEVVHIVSSREGQRFKINTYKAMDTDEFYYEESHVNGTIFVNPETKYQRILGFGSTLTDASCTNVDNLPDEIREKLIKDYFSPEDGIALNLMKVPIGSTKYSFTNYVLDQPDRNEVELSPYDTDHRIPIIKDALKAAGKLKNRVKIIASSATAPPDFKENSKMIHGGNLKQDKYHDYASYLIGFIAAYKSQELNVWSLILSESPVTVSRNQNANDSLNHNSMSMTPSETIKLIRTIDHVKTKHHPEVDKFRLMLLGDNRTYAPVWADTVFQSKEAPSVAGLAYICDNVTVAPYDNLVYVTKRYPNKYLLAAQGSINAPVKLGNWQYAENYITEIIKNLEFGSVGWIDFNLALNLDGGPNIDEKFKGKV